MKIPKLILTALLICIGVFSFFIFIEPQDVCKTQIQLFKEDQVGNLYPLKIKNFVKISKISQQFEFCKQSNQPGGCFEYFLNLKKMLRDLHNINNECSSYIQKESEISVAYKNAIQLMALLAWGSQPPANSYKRFGWLEAADLNLFCQIQSSFIRINGKEAWDRIRVETYSLYPGEAPEYAQGACVNCKTRKPANKVLDSNQIWSLSLFSVPCANYR